MRTLFITSRGLAAAAAMLFALGSIGSSSAVAAADVWRTQEFHATVAGSSTLHDWSVESRSNAGEVCFGEALSGRLEIPVTSLSGGPKGLNERMYAALKADAHPTIVFEAIDGTSLPERSAPASVTVRGRLTIAGRSQEIAVPCQLSSPTADTMVFEAEMPLLMTDYGIKPPTFMGMIRTGDKVVVRIRWLVTAGEAAVGR